MLKSVFKRIAVLLALPAIAGLPALAEHDYERNRPADREPGLVIFDGANFTGNMREVYELIPRLGEIRFNDRAKSIIVLGGAWEVCEHADFRGRCVILREDVRDLREFHLSRRITAIRQITEQTDARHGLMFTRDAYGRIRYLQDYYGRDYAGYGTRRDYYHFGYTDDYRYSGYYQPSYGYGPYGCLLPSRYDYGYNRRSRFGYGYGSGHGHGTGREWRRRRPGGDTPRRPVVDRPDPEPVIPPTRPNVRPDISGVTHPDRRRRPHPDRFGGSDVAVLDPDIDLPRVTGPMPNVRPRQPRISPQSPQPRPARVSPPARPHVQTPPPHRPQVQPQPRPQPQPQPRSQPQPQPQVRTHDRSPRKTGGPRRFDN